MRPISLSLAALAGLVFGLSIDRAVPAEERGGVLVVDEVEPTDMEADAKIAPLFGPVAKQFGGQYLVRGGKTVSFSGEPPKRVVVIAFHDMEAAKAWRESPKHRELEQMRLKIGTKIRSFAVQTVSQ